MPDGTNHSVELEAAAEIGARRALERIGLHDENAMADIRDLRSLLEGYRALRRGALQGVARAIAVAVAGAIIGWAAAKLGGH